MGLVDGDRVDFSELASRAARSPELSTSAHPAYYRILEAMASSTGSADWSELVVQFSCGASVSSSSNQLRTRRTAVCTGAEVLPGEIIRKRPSEATS